jgi:hypothetical protein
MKPVGIMGTAILSLLLGASVPGFAQQDQPNRKEDRDRKDENRGRPDRPQPSRGVRQRDFRREQQMQQQRRRGSLPDSRSSPLAAASPHRAD